MKNNPTSKNVIWHDHKITKEKRSEQKKQKPVILWFTGLSGSGKYLYKRNTK